MRMTVILCWIVGFVIATSGLFHITLQVEALEDRLVNLNRQILKEQENIHMLQAEWSYLNRPDRLQKLTENLLPHMKPVQARQFVSLQTLPFRLDDEAARPDTNKPHKSYKSYKSHKSHKSHQLSAVPTSHDGDAQ